MEISLHIGAHRTGTTTFQRFMTQNRFGDIWGRDGVAFWGPMRTRRGLFSGLIRNTDTTTPRDRAAAQRSCGRIKMEITRLGHDAVSHLVVSDENMIGSMRQNMTALRLYPQIRPRLGAFAPAFGGHRLRITLSVRSYHSYWASSLAYLIKAGHHVPDTDMLDHLVTQPRRWRDVICDVSHVFPEAEITVLPFEGVIGDTQEQFETVLGLKWPCRLTDSPDICNASPTAGELAGLLRSCGDMRNAALLEAMPDRYMPFDGAQIAKMRADYDADINWLLDGAEGRARYIDPIEGTFDGIFDTEGSCDDRYEERLVRTG